MSSRPNTVPSVEVAKFLGRIFEIPRAFGYIQQHVLFQWRAGRLWWCFTVAEAFTDRDGVRVLAQPGEWREYGLTVEAEWDIAKYVTDGEAVWFEGEVP